MLDRVLPQLNEVHTETTFSTNLQSYEFHVLKVAAAYMLFGMAASVFPYLVYFYLFYGSSNLIDAGSLALSAVSLFLAVWGLSGGAKLQALRQPSVQSRVVLRAWFVSYFLLAWIAFLLGETRSLSRGAIFLGFCGGAVVMPIFGHLIARSLHVRLRAGRQAFAKVAFVGIGSPDAFSNEITALAESGLAVVSQHYVSDPQRGRMSYLEGCKAAVDGVRDALTQHRLEGVMVSVPWHERRAVDELRVAVSTLPVPVVLLADGSVNRLLKKPISVFGSVAGVEMQRAPLTRYERATKRALDIVCSLCGIIALSPIFVLTSIAILIESGGPVLFRQDRKGFGGKPFQILKFRSMRVQENGAVVKQAEKHDSRVTKVGNFIRRTSIDELPQLINVLRGDMSIVGPRPHAIAHDNFYDRVIASYAFRHHVKPGITGWAQVNGLRGNTSELSQMEERIEKDIWYINNWSLRLDVKIIVRTAVEVLRHDNAY